MNNSKKANDVPDFRNEEDVWMRTPEEKGKAFLERYLKQTDQKNEQARRDLMSRMETYFEDQNAFMFPHKPISSEVVKNLISQADESSPGPDGIKYSDLGTFDEEELEALTQLLNDRPCHSRRLA